MLDPFGRPRSLLLLGGTSEIAVATALRWADPGPLHVTVAARPSGRRREAVARLTSAGCTVTTVDFDARRPDDHADVIATAAATHDVDVALLAFGVLGDQEQAWQDLAAALDLAETNYLAVVSCGVALAELVRRQGHGVLVCLSSVAAERPRRSNFVYGSTKAGADAFCTGLGEALRPLGGHVVVVRPGFVRSRMTAGLKAAPLATTPHKVAEQIVQAVDARRDQVWVPAALRVVMSVLRHLPRPVFRRLPL